MFVWRWKRSNLSTRVTQNIRSNYPSAVAALPHDDDDVCTQKLVRPLNNKYQQVKAAVLRFANVKLETVSRVMCVQVFIPRNEAAFKRWKASNHAQVQAKGKAKRNKSE